MIKLPAMKIAQGEPFAYDLTVSGQDWTGWTGTATFKASVKATYRRTPDRIEQEPIITATVTPGALGLLEFSLTAAETADFPALERVGYFRQAICEIAMTGGSDVQKFQAPVLVAAEI